VTAPRHRDTAPRSALHLLCLMRVSDGVSKREQTSDLNIAWGFGLGICSHTMQPIPTRPDAFSSHVPLFPSLCPGSRNDSKQGYHLLPPFPDPLGSVACPSSQLPSLDPRPAIYRQHPLDAPTSSTSLVFSDIYTHTSSRHHFHPGTNADRAIQSLRSCPFTAPDPSSERQHDLPHSLGLNISALAQPLHRSSSPRGISYPPPVVDTTRNSFGAIAAPISSPASPDSFVLVVPPSNRSPRRALIARPRPTKSNPLPRPPRSVARSGLIARSSTLGIRPLDTTSTLPWWKTLSRDLTPALLRLLAWLYSLSFVVYHTAHPPFRPRHDHLR
jgi:hypothetical protein